MAHTKQDYQKLPNILTFSRIIMIPVVIALIYIPNYLTNIIAAGLFLAACLTDYLDGYFARSLKQSSNLGRFLDPIADKLLVSAILLMLVELKRISGISIIPAIVIFCREILVSGLREYLAELKVTVPVSRLAKWKTGIQMFALGFLLINPMHAPDIPFHQIGITGLWCAAILTLVTGYDYLRHSFKHLIKDQ